MNVPVFSDSPLTEQVSALRTYMKSIGAEIPEMSEDKDFADEVYQLYKASSICWKLEPSEQEDKKKLVDLDSVMNCLVSLVFGLPSEKAMELVNCFCQKTLEAEGSSQIDPIRISVLFNLFFGLNEFSPCRYQVYSSLIKLATGTELLDQLNPDLDQIKKWMGEWKISVEQQQRLLRDLHRAFVSSRQSEKGSRVMEELLRSYSSETADAAREDAERCIVACLDDLKTYLMDHLLELPPIRALQGEPIYELLTIFVSGSLDDYIAFHAEQHELIESLGLSHERLTDKMRLLTFLLMGQSRKELSFSELEQDLRLEPNQVEAFVIDAIRTRTVRAKIDECSRRVIVSWTSHRTFGYEQWLSLQHELDHWNRSLKAVMSNVSSTMSTIQ